MTTLALQILLLAGVLQAVQLIAVLTLRAAGNKAATALRALLAVAGAVLVDYTLLVSGNAVALPWLAGFSLPLLFLLGPLLLAYVALQSGQAPARAWAWHGLPALACTLLMLPWWSLPAADKASWLSALTSSGYAGSQLGPLVGCLLLCLQFVVYSYHADRLLEHYDQALREQQAGAAVQVVEWLRLVTRGFCLFQLLFYLAWAEWLYFDPAAWHFTQLMMAVLAALLVLAGLWSQLHPASLGTTVLATLPVLTPEAREAKYARSRLDAAQLQRHLAMLARCMQEQRPYLDPELRLPTLAELVGLPPNLLSQIINEGLGCNYFEYINRQRVDHALRLLDGEAAPHTNLLDIALAAGFNSKATFNRSFRQHTGQAPSAYLARQAAFNR